MASQWVAGTRRTGARFSGTGNHRGGIENALPSDAGSAAVAKVSVIEDEAIRIRLAAAGAWSPRANARSAYVISCAWVFVGAGRAVGERQRGAGT